MADDSSSTSGVEMTDGKTWKDVRRSSQLPEPEERLAPSSKKKSERSQSKAPVPPAPMNANLTVRRILYTTIVGKASELRKPALLMFIAFATFLTYYVVLLYQIDSTKSFETETELLTGLLGGQTSMVLSTKV